jgi:hypothetical protein
MRNGNLSQVQITRFEVNLSFNAYDQLAFVELESAIRPATSMSAASQLTATHQPKNEPDGKRSKLRFRIRITN